MKHSFLPFVICIFFLILVTGCSKEEQNQAPVCSITNPVNGDTIETGDIVVISVDADDADGFISGASFYVDGNGIGSLVSSPYNYTWNTDNVATGSHTVKVTVKDNEESAASDEITVTIEEKAVVENQSPVCSITSPDDGDTIVIGNTVVISVDADDNDGYITGVSFYVDGDGIGSLVSSLYNCIWNTDDVASGSHTVRAVAKDNEESTATDEITVFLEEKVSHAPVCSITSPVNGDTIVIGNTVIISADAADTEVSIAEVRFYIDGTGVCSLSSVPYSFAWNTDDVATGNHIIKIIATNYTGSSASDEITVTVTEPDIPGTVTDYDGNVYQTVLIGDQLWMAENLNATHYADGTTITLVESSSAWVNLDTEDQAYCYYDNFSSLGNTYGALYTWGAAMNGQNSSSNNPSGIQGVCPDGWHMPGDDEWKQLEMYLGMSQSDADETGYRGTNQGSMLAGNINLWDYGSLENDTAFEASGFNALPAGRRGNNASFYGLFQEACFWSATEYNFSAGWSHSLNYSNSAVNHSPKVKEYGYSVRCIKD